MKLSPDDPQVTAYALNELDAQSRAAIQATIREDPAFLREVEAIRETAGLLSAALEREECPRLSPARQEALLRARQPWPSVLTACILLLQRWSRGPAFAAAGLTALGTIALVFLTQTLRSPEQGSQGEPAGSRPVGEAVSVIEPPATPPPVVVEAPASVRVPIPGPIPPLPGATAPQVVQPGVPTAPLVQSEPADGVLAGQGLQLAAIPLVLPAPTLKGTPEDIPTGSHIEPRSEKPRPPFLAPPGVRNLALGQKAVGSDARPFSGAYDQVTDGQKEAFDDEVVEMRRNTQWVQVDLGIPSAIYAIAIWHDHRWLQVYHDVIVQVADDADFTQNVRTVFNNDMDNSSGRGIGTDKEYFESEQGRLIDAQGVTARFVRAYSRGSNLSALNCIQEIEVFGLPVRK